MNADHLGRVLASMVLFLTSLGTSFGQGFADLGRGADHFARVLPGATLEFPKEFGSHPDYRIERWYVTAILNDAQGASYGVQWTRALSQPRTCRSWK